MTFLLTHLKGVRRSRIKTLAFLVFGLLEKGRASVTGIGRALPGPTQIKHKIKRADRFLANAAIDFSTVTPLLVAMLPRDPWLLVLVDWTAHGEDTWTTITAQVPVEGRCLPVLAHTHKRLGQDQRGDETAFLAELAELLKPWPQVIIVADAGFRRGFRDDVRAHGWHLIGRLHGCDHMKTSQSWHPVSKLRIPRGGLQAWPGARVGKGAKVPEVGQVVAYWVPKQPSRPRTKANRINPSDAAYRKKAERPWVLFTTLTEWAAEDVVRAYAQRFQIEESFRDWKNHRFCGYQLEDVVAKTPERLERLLAILAVAYVLQVAHGLVARQHGWEPAFRVNRSKRTQIGAFILGGLVLKAGRACNWRTMVRAVRLAHERVWETIRSGLLPLQPAPGAL